MKIMPIRQVLTAAVCSFFFLFVFIGCKKNPVPPPDSNPAHGYFAMDETGRCGANTVVHGTWYNGLPANTDTNYVDVSVYVTHAGSYNIFSDTVNGVKFTGSGNFADTGLQTARLKGTGSFKLPGTGVTFPVHFDSSTCKFVLTVMDSAGIGIAANTWTFTAQGHVYSGPFTLNIFDVPQLGEEHFVLDGNVAGHPDTAFGIELIYGNSASKMDTGHYLTSARSINSVMLFITNPGIGGIVKSLYTTNTSLGAVIDVHETSRLELTDPNYHVISVASFNGSMVDTAGHVVPITNAKFKWDSQ